MAKRNVKIKIVNYGIYDKFDHDNEDLPTLVEFAEKIPAKLDIEFGMIVNIRKARGEVIEWRIDHPEFDDSRGNPAPPFEGEFYVNSPEYKFFLGDTIWEPIETKQGAWELSIMWQGNVLARKRLWVVPEDEYLRLQHNL